MKDLPRHCWIRDQTGPVAGLLLEWRRTSEGLQGRVVRPIVIAGSAYSTEEWIPAERIDLVTVDLQTPHVPRQRSAG